MNVGLMVMQRREGGEWENVYMRPNKHSQTVVYTVGVYGVKLVRRRTVLYQAVFALKRGFAKLQVQYCT